MYIPPANAEHSPEVLGAFMRAHPFATLVTVGESQALWATHLPVIFDSAKGPHGSIEGHVARANLHHQLARSDSEDGEATAERESLVIFAGPDAYVTPSWYAAKRAHGRVVPTWNYAAVHAYGHLEVHDDPSWLLAHVTRLTDQSERGRSAPWEVADAPEDYIAAQLKGIVGVEMRITRVEGKWKMSQNRASGDIDGVVEGLGGSARQMDREVGELVNQRRPDRADRG